MLLIHTVILLETRYISIFISVHFHNRLPQSSHLLPSILKEVSSSSSLCHTFIVSLENVCIGKLPREHFIGHIQFKSGLDLPKPQVYSI